jgi:transcriptional regulator with XRE-family HTH domain
MESFDKRDDETEWGDGTKWDVWIGERISKARKEREWTQSELAKHMHKSQTNISDYERGRVNINVVDLCYIALALRKPLTFFTPPKFNGATRDDLTETQKEIIDYLSETSEEMQLALLEQAKTYAKISRKIADQENEEEIEAQLPEVEAEKQRARKIIREKR